MTTSVAEIIPALTADAVLVQILDALDGAGFPVTAWQAGNPGRSLAKADSVAIAELRAVIAEACAGGFLDDALALDEAGKPDWLTLLAKGVFDVDRGLAIFAEGTVPLTVASGVGPYTLSPGALIVTDGERRWVSSNTSNVALPAGVTTSVPVRAEVAGDDYNALGVPLSIVSPALAGVTAGAGTLTVSGAPQETGRQLVARCRARWATLGRGATAAAYEYWATTTPAAPEVRRVQVVAGPGDGTLTVYIAQATTTATGGQVAAVQAYVDTQRPLTDSPSVVAAAAVTVTVTATVTVRAASDSTANRLVATDAIADLFEDLAVGEGVDREAIAAAIYRAAGVRDVDFSSPAGDTAIGTGQVAVLGAVTLTWVPV